MSLIDNHNICLVPEHEIHTSVQVKNIRQYFDEDKIRLLANDIYEHGLLYPLTIMDSFDNNNNELTELVTGARRLRAIRLIINEMDPDFMDDGVPCLQFEGTHHQAVFCNAKENITQSSLNDVEVSQWIYERSEDGVAHVEIAQYIGQSPQWVSFRYNFHVRAAEEVKQALVQGLLGFTTAYELSKNLGEAEQIKFVNKAISQNERISLDEARVAGKSKSIKPSKKLKDAMLSRAMVAAEDRGSEIAKGIESALKWVEGLLIQMRWRR